MTKRIKGYCPECYGTRVYELGVRQQRGSRWYRRFFGCRGCGHYWHSAARGTSLLAEVETPNPPTEQEQRRKEYGRD